MTQNRLFLLVVVFALFGLPVLAQDDAVETVELPECPILEGEDQGVRTSYYIGEARGYLNSNQFTAATDSLDCIILVIDPQYVPAYMLRGATYFQRRLLEEAVEDYSEAIRLDTNLLAAYSNRGLIHVALQEYDAAAADFDRVLEIGADYIAGYNNRAILYAIEGDTDAAIALLEDAIARTGIADTLAEIEDPERDPNAEFPEFPRVNARAYGLLGIMHSLRALDAYNDYLTLTRGNADNRIAQAAGALESRFAFDLRLDDGSWLLRADYDPFGTGEASE